MSDLQYNSLEVNHCCHNYSLQYNKVISHLEMAKLPQAFQINLRNSSVASFLFLTELSLSLFATSSCILYVSISGEANRTLL